MKIDFKIILYIFDPENWIWKSQEIHKIAKPLKFPILFHKKSSNQDLLEFGGALKLIDL